MSEKRTSCMFSNDAQQIKQPTSNLNSIDFKLQNKSLSFGSTTATTGVAFGTSTIGTPSEFSFSCARPIPENAQNKRFFNGTLPRPQFSFFTANASTPLANLFNKTVSTSTSSFVPSLTSCSASVPTTAAAVGFGTTTAAVQNTQFSFKNKTNASTGFKFAFEPCNKEDSFLSHQTVQNAQFSLKNETDASTGFKFAFEPCNKEDPFLSHQNASNANISNNFTLFTAPIIASSANTACTGFSFKDVQGINDCKGFSAVKVENGMTSSVSLMSASNLIKGFNSEMQQTPNFQFGTPTCHSAINSFVCPDRSSCFHATKSSQLSSSTQSGNADGLNVSNRIVLKRDAVIRNQCISCMREHENKSLEEIRMDSCDTIRKKISADSGLEFKNGACNFSFLNAAQSSHNFMGDIFSPTQNNQNSTESTSPLTFITDSFGHDKVSTVSFFDQNKQHKKQDQALNVSNDGDSEDQAEKSQNVLKRIFDDPKYRSHVNGSSNESGFSNPVFSQPIRSPPPTNNDVKKLALDSLIAVMIISKTKSIPAVLDMIPGNVGLDNFKAHLISAAEEFKSELLSKKVDELVKRVTNISSKIIYIKLPTGELLIRNFMADTPLSLLLLYIASQGYPDLDYKVLTIWSPQQDLTTLNKDQTLEDLKLYPKVFLTVEKR